MKKYKVCIEGISPLLMHGSQNVGMDGDTGKKKGGNALLGDKNEWKKTIYFDENIGVYVPAINIEASLIEGAKQYKIGRGSATKYVKSGVFITDNELQLKVDGNTIKSLDEVEVDQRTVKNPSTKGRNMRYRAIFKMWSTEFTIMVSSDDYISEDLLKNIIDYSGMYVGVCDFRPRFGRFKVTKFEEV